MRNHAAFVVLTMVTGILSSATCTASARLASVAPAITISHVVARPDKSLSPKHDLLYGASGVLVADIEGFREPA